MKPLSVALLSAGIAILASVTTSHCTAPEKASSTRTTTTTRAMEHILASGKIRCGYAVWPPALLKDPNTGKMSGINYDVMEAIGRELDLKIEWTEEVGFGNFIEGLRNHRYDVMCSSVWPDAPRIRYLLYSDPTYYSPIYAYARSDDHRFDGNLDRINQDDVTISAIDGDISVTQARIDFPQAKVFALPQTAEGSEVLLSVASKKADIVFTDRGNFEMFDKSNPGQIQAIPNVPPATIFAEPFVFLPEDIQLQSMFNLAIRNLINNGKIEKIIRRYPHGNYLFPAVNYKPAATP